MLEPLQLFISSTLHLFTSSFLSPTSPPLLLFPVRRESIAAVTLLRWLGCLWLALTIPSSAQELLRNGDFALLGTDGLAQHWIALTLGSEVESACELVSEGAAGAQRIIVRRLPPFRWSGIAQIVPKLDAGLYRLRARVKSDRPLPVSVEVRSAADPYPLFGRCRETLQPGAWTELTAFIRLEAAQTNLYSLVLLHQPGVVLAAEASLRPVRPAELGPAERTQLERQFGPELPPVDEAALLAATDARILQTRTAPLRVQVLDRAGRPAAHRTVRIEHRQHLFRFGAGFELGLPRRPNETVVDRRHREAFLKLFNTATIRFYWASYEPERGAFDHAGMFRAIRWLERRGLTVRAHPVFWNSAGQIPAWVKEISPPPLAMERLCDQRLAQLGRTVLPCVTDADLFNELVHWEHLESDFTRLVADQGKVRFVADYLRAAKRMTPPCQTVINDYDTTPAYFSLLKDLLEAGAPVDLIGQQAHMHATNWTPTLTWTVLERLSVLRRPILFTEVSVLSGPNRFLHTAADLENWQSDPEHEARQADYLEQFLKLLYSHPNCAGLVLWDYSDRGAWLNAPVGVLRVDGSPKPSFARLDELLNRRWRTRGEFQTDANGTVLVPHAYEGRYEIQCGRTKVEVEHSRKQPLNLVTMEPLSKP
ncbi:MAG: endo-1,4-beta-xylanase [Verrucomicrobia bacterium]|nr:endo-1,4-beta-xylanase [Verrucomicrobiota bacterium]